MLYRLRRLFSTKPPKWLVIAFGLLLIALVIWFVGPLVAIAGAVPLGSWKTRAIAIALVLLIAAGIWGLRRWRARKRNSAMVAELAASGTGGQAAAGPDASEADIAAMNARAASALELMRTTRVGKNRAFIYELPWYVIIGPPGAGKTTALQNAGLDFPVAQSLGDGPVRGIGGTRTIEWWFTDKAVLIDTAGRYTTQDSDAAVDAKAWTGLLDLLKKHRPRQPVTGVIVAIAATDLIGADESAALGHGRAVRQRLNEIQAAFGVRTPVYVVLTKLDLLAGFTEFFDDLPQSEREQVWGSTLLYDPAAQKSDAPDDTTFGRLFDALIGRLDERLLLRVQAEPDMARRGLIFGFPQQVATLRAPLLSLMRIVARETKFEPTPLVRGFYLTSATQFGRPIDRLMNAISARVGIDLVTSPGDAPRGRSYFLHDLLDRVVFPEAAIAGRDLKAERRRRRVRLGLIGAATATMLGVTALWTLAYLRNAALVGRLELRAGALRDAEAALGRGPVADDDVTRVLPVLEAARALPFASTAVAADASPGRSWGVGREHQLRPEVDGTYRNLLNRHLLPRLLLTLEGEVARLDKVGDAPPAAPGQRVADARPEIYNLLRVYLMLGRAAGAPIDRGAIQAWFVDRWADAFPAEEQAPLRAALARHLAALLAGPLTPPKLNAPLIADARARIGTLGPGERVYVRMLADERLREMQPFALTDVPGLANARLFRRKSGVPLSTGIPGMYRHTNFYPTVVATIGRYAAQSADEGWVTGEARGGGATTSGAGKLKDALLTAYLADFTNRWDDFINDIAVSGERPIRDRIQLATRPPSPVRSLFNTLANETDLTPPSLKQGSATRGGLQVAAIFSRTIYRGVQRGDQVGAAFRGGPPKPPGPLDEVIDHFRWLREMLPAGGAGPLDQALGALAAVGDSGGAAAAAAGLGSPALQQSSSAAAMGATAKLAQVSATLPPQAGGLFDGFVKASATQLNRDAHNAVRQQYGQSLLPECTSILGGGYPFTPNAGRQVSLDDFSRLFRPDGLLDTFQKTALAGQIDTSGTHWALSPSGKALGLNATAVRNFEKSAQIRALFFKPGDIRPNLRFTAELARLSGDASSVTLTIDGVPATFTQGVARPIEMRWPGATPGVTLAFQHNGKPAASPRTWPGEWAFPLMARDLGARSATPDGVTLTATDGAASATIRIRMAAAGSYPFIGTLLSEFQCPTKL